MRSFAAVSLLALFFLAPAFAQRYGSASGFGNVVFPGTGHAPRNPSVSGFGNVIFPGTAGPPRANIPYSITDRGFASRLAGTVNPLLRPQGSLGGAGRRGGQGGMLIPYAYPVYVGGYDQQYAEPQQPNVVVVYPPAQPPVVVNQSFGTPAPQVPAEPAEEEGVRNTGVRIYDAPAHRPEDNPVADPDTYYLIAFKGPLHLFGGGVLGGWRKPCTTFTRGNNHNQVSIALVDLPLTQRLNRERRVEFRAK